MKDYIGARGAYIRSLGMVVTRKNPISLAQLMACRSDEARRLLLKIGKTPAKFSVSEKFTTKERAA